MKTPHVYKNLDCSTVHITKADSVLLNGRDIGLSIQNTDYGWLVFCGTNDGIKNIREGLKAAGFSLAFVDLFLQARQLGCKWLDLDCDGMTYDDLPKFEWEK